jgi:hypothetical protein
MLVVKTSVPEPHHFYSALAKNFDAAPAAPAPQHWSKHFEQHFC